MKELAAAPTLLILIYPLITMNFPYTHKGSREKSRLGKNPDQGSCRFNVESQKQVNLQTPPAFLVHATEDSVVAAENSIMFYSALRKAGVPGRNAYIFKRPAWLRAGKK